jgi:hypothetical protein
MIRAITSLVPCQTQTSHERFATGVVKRIRRLMSSRTKPCCSGHGFTRAARVHLRAEFAPTILSAFRNRAETR